MSQLRKDVITGEWVIIAQEREGRPYQFGENDNIDECPFCPGNEHMTPGETFRINDENGWQLRVVPNKFPAVCENNDSVDDQIFFYTICEGTGRHEIVIETPLHDKGLHELGQQKISDVFIACRKRFKELSQLEEVEYVQIFKNFGKNGGASLPHSHSQIVALSFVPRRIQKEMRGAKKYYERKKKCVFCDLIREEITSQERIIFENEYFIVATAFAPKFAYETIFIPKIHEHDFSKVDDNVLFGFAEAFKKTMTMMTKVLGDFPYNLILHTAPYKSEENYYHWHIELVPRVSYHAGFELATEACVNSMFPEEAARRIRG